MTQKSYAKNAWMILGISAALLFFFFALVAHHGNITEQVRQHRSAPLGAGSSVAERIKPVAELSIAAAQPQGEPAKGAPAPAAKGAVAAAPARDGQQVYQATCVACHGAGIAGAPKVADKGQWAKRIAKGVGTLYASAVNGVQGSAGAMPAKGGNPALSNAEVKAAVDYMVAQSK
jgi:cytochrome c5